MSLPIICLFRKCMIFAPSGARPYGRWVHRKPTKVSFPFESAELKEEKIVELDEKLLEKTHGKDAASDKTFKPPRNDKSSRTDKPIKTFSTKYKEVVGKDELSSGDIKHLVSQDNVGMPHEKKIPKLVASAKEENKVFDANGDVIYTRLQNDNTQVSSILSNAKSKKIRFKSGQIIIEGWRVIAEGLAAGYKMDALFFSKKDDLMKLRPFLPSNGPKIYKIPYKEIQMWSYVETTPGIMGVFKIKDMTHIEKKNSKDKCLPLNIICDNIRDPGNLGSILRIAAAVGSQKLLLTKGCVDLWDPKVIRSASGAHFNLNIQTKLDWYDCKNLIEKNTLFCIADNNMKMPIIKATVSQIKLSEDLSFEARKNFRDSLEEDNEKANDGNVQRRDDPIRIPITSYFDMDFTSTGNVTLVVGGETEGLSDDCFIYADMLKGVRLNIPMQSGSESLNAGSAMAVIAFEIRKQFLSKISNKDLNTASMYA